MDTQHIKSVLEAALLSAAEPLDVTSLITMFDDAFSKSILEDLLVELVSDWESRSVNLVCVSAGWRFQTRTEYKSYLDKLNPEKTPKYSRSVIETLAIIAYKQPVTRGDIEMIRGVTVSSDIIKKLEDRGWIEIIGHRDAPGRPALFATTKHFLDDLALKSLSDLPRLASAEILGGMLGAEQARIEFEAVVDTFDTDAKSS